MLDKLIGRAVFEGDLILSLLPFSAFRSQETSKELQGVTRNLFFNLMSPVRGVHLTI